MTRHRITEAVIGVVLGAIAVGAIWLGLEGFLPHKASYPRIPTVTDIRLSSYDLPPGTDRTPGSRIASVPVVAWHQMDNGCTPTARLCTSPGYSEDNVTQQQFYDQISWLHAHGYRTITAQQYVRWATGRPVLLPAKPILLTVDDGIANFYAGATPVLKHFGYNMVSMVVSGFAQGASDNLRQYRGWDATWTQLGNLPASTWGFAFHAGPKGHTLSGASCPYFYPCQRPAESAAAYHSRVSDDINAGLTAERQHLGSRLDTQMWAVPFNDLAQASNEPQSGHDPAEWLDKFAAHRFEVVFVDGLTSQANQHYRYEVHGTDTLKYFASQVGRSYLFDRIGANTAGARPGGQS